MTIYEQIYNGDHKNVGRIIGTNGCNINAFKDYLPFQYGSILLMHWESSNNTWIVRGTTRKAVTLGIDWILNQEKHLHMLEYEEIQVKSLESLEVKEVEISRQPSVKLERQHAGGWTNSSDNLDWRNQNEKEQVQKFNNLEVQVANDLDNIESQHADGWNLEWRNQQPPTFPESVDELSPISDLVDKFYEDLDN